MGLVGIFIALVLLIWLAYRGGGVLLLAPAAALVAAAVSRQPLLGQTRTQTFMGSAAQFVAQFFPIFLLGAVFGKLMEDSGSVSAIAEFMTEKLGPRRAILAVVLAGAFVTYGGVSLLNAGSLRAGAHGAGAVSGRGNSEAADAGGARARHLDLHHVGAAWNAGDPERDPNAVFRHHAVRGAGPWRDRLGDHARLRTVVARTRRSRRPPRRRGLWRGCRRQDRCGTKRGPR